jgi:hypothetical protein
MNQPCHFFMHQRLRSSLRGSILALAMIGVAAPALGGGVTVITHGFNGNVTDWIIPMADRYLGNPSFPGKEISCYQLSVSNEGYSATFLGGAEPTSSDSGEIIVKLDWSALAGLFGGASSTVVAEKAAQALAAPNLIPALGGRPLAELPLHLVGHSRGGSVVTELARFLGARGIWVDHVTTMDPRPVFDDAAVATFANVLYADNFWQDLGDGFFTPNGQVLPGAYNRKLIALDGGYASSHSDAHLWYHGTIELVTPATDTGATITATERTTWWTADEAMGANVGFHFSRIGGGARKSAAEPAGPGTGMISDGVNRTWDFGSGIADNRTPLPANAGTWPNVILCQLLDTRPAGAEGSIELKVTHQSGAADAGDIRLDVFLDADRNPYNGGEIELATRIVANTGPEKVESTSLTVALDADSVPPGSYSLFAVVDDGTRRRSLYAAGVISVGSAVAPPSIDSDSLVVTAGTVSFNVHALPGQHVAVRASADLEQWTAIATKVMTDSVWGVVDGEQAAFPKRFYRVEIVP